MNAINTNLTKLLINSHILIFRVFETAGTLLLYYSHDKQITEYRKRTRKRFDFYFH